MSKTRTPKPLSIHAAEVLTGVPAAKLQEAVNKGELVALRPDSGVGNGPIVNQHDVIAWVKKQPRMFRTNDPFTNKPVYYIARPEGSWDQETVEEVRNTYFTFIRPEKDDVWVDAGAHIGAFSFLISPYVKRVLAYEPQKENYALLQQNTESLRNVTTFDCGVGLKDGTYAFHENPTKTTTMNSILPIHQHRKGGANETTITTTALDVVLHKYQVNAIKLDIEGAEFALLPLLLSNRRVKKLVMEWHKSFRKTASGEGIDVPTVAELKVLFQDAFDWSAFVHTKKELIIHARRR